MNIRHFLGTLLLGSLLVPSARSDEISWRTDYGVARQEALEKERPLVLEFSSEDCFWCRQLEARTFSVPRIAALLNEKFVPLKVDAGQYPTLVNALNVQGFPTIVVASPAGKVLDRQNGFLEAPKFEEFLNAALAKNSPASAPALAETGAPNWMNEEYQKAVQAAARMEFPNALNLLRHILHEERKYAVQTKAAQLLKEIEDQAATRLERVKQLEAAGRFAEAVQADQELVRLFDTSTAAAEGLALLSSLTRRASARTEPQMRQARELIVQARDDFNTHHYVSCLEHCETILRSHPDLPEAEEARELAGQVRASPEAMQQVCDSLPEWHSSLYLSMAEVKLKMGQPQQAVFYLERLIQAYPGTRHAESAQVLLSQIQGTPSVPVSEEPKP